MLIATLRALPALVLAGCAATTYVVVLDVPAAPQSSGSGSISYTQPAPFEADAECACARLDLDCELEGGLLRFDWYYAAGEFPAVLEPTTCAAGDRTVDVVFTRYAPVPLPWIDQGGRVMISRSSPTESLTANVRGASTIASQGVSTPGIRCERVEGGVLVVVCPHPPVSVPPGSHWCPLDEEPDQGVELVLLDLDR